MVESDDVLVPASTPRPAKGGLGCLTTVVLFVLVIVIGLIVGTVLSGDDDEGDADERSEVISDGTFEEGGRQLGWHLDAEIDESGDTCVFLYEEAVADPVTGSCDDTPQAATLGPTTIVFGLVDSDARSVTVELTDGSRPQLDTFAVDGFDGRFYVHPVSGEVDAEETPPAASS